MEREPTVLFCVGATKAGTSWVYRYLHDRPDCHFRSVKELHYYDTVDLNDYEYQIAEYQSARDTLRGQLNDADAWKTENIARRIEDLDALITMLSEPKTGEQLYRDYLMGGHRSGLVGDITPGYSRLSSARLTQMANEFPTSRFVFLMRDPVERLWSHVRMLAKRRLKEGEAFAEKARRFLVRVCERAELGHIAERGDYISTISRLRKSVSSDRLLVSFTERLFTKSGLTQLCEFLGLSYLAGNFSELENQSPKLAMNEEQRLMAARYLAPQYAYVNDNFGTLPANWQANMVKAIR